MYTNQNAFKSKSMKPSNQKGFITSTISNSIYTPIKNNHLSYPPNYFAVTYNIGIGKANGTFGELLQGILPKRKNFMVTLPIRKFSKAMFIPTTHHEQIEVFPKHKTKSQLLVKILLKYFNIRIGGLLIIESELPEGKGLASSSADLVATAHAVSSSIRVRISRELICKLIHQIEPSDGVMYDGIVSFKHKELKLIEHLGKLPNLTTIAIDEGGSIDTIEYNKRTKQYTHKDQVKYTRLLSEMAVAIKKRDMKMIGNISTQSAIMNQQRNPKKHLDKLIKICKLVRGLGVVVAHSGTYLGILLDSDTIDFENQKLLCIEKLKQLSNNPSIFLSIN